MNAFQVYNTLINMGMDKYGCFIQFYVYYYWNHSQQRIKTRHVSKVIDVCQKINIHAMFPLLLFLCTEYFTYTNLFMFLQLASSEHAKFTFIITFVSVTRDEVEDSNAEEFRVLITKLNKRTKTTPKGKNKQAGRRLEHSQTFNSHDMDTRKTTDQHRTADTRRTI